MSLQRGKEEQLVDMSGSEERGSLRGPSRAKGSSTTGGCQEGEPQEAAMVSRLGCACSGPLYSVSFSNNNNIIIIIKIPLYNIIIIILM